MENQPYYSDTREWETGNDRLLRLAIFLTLPIAIIGFRYLMRGGPFLFIVLLLILIFIVYQILGVLTPPAIHKTFYVPPYDAQQIIKNLLSEKNMPYEEENGRFRVGAIKITIKTKLELSLRAGGCIIQITPFTADEESFVLSLCTKIDNAFAPKGL